MGESGAKMCSFVDVRERGRFGICGFEIFLITKTYSSKSSRSLSSKNKEGAFLVAFPKNDCCRSRKTIFHITALQSGSRTAFAVQQSGAPAHPSSAKCGGVPRIVGRATCAQAADPVRVKASLQPHLTTLGSVGPEVGQPAASSLAAFCLERTRRFG